MKAFKIFASLCVAGFVSSCAFLLDFDELQQDPGADAAAGGSAGAAGTSGNAGTDGGGGKGPDLQALAQMTAKGMCDKIAACFGAPAMPMVFRDEDCNQLLLRTLANATFGLVAESLKVGHMSIDESGIDKCIQSFAALACKDVGLDFPDACRQALKGNIAPGENCAHTLECTPGHYCSLGAGCPGKCAPFRKDGQTCSDTELCAAGMGCTNGACKPLALPNEACEGPTGPNCATGAFCFGSDDTKSGACADTKGLFSAQLGGECSGWAEAGLDPANAKLCAVGACPIFKLKAVRKCSGKIDNATPPGAPCDVTLPDSCPTDQYCLTPSAFQFSGSCQALPGNGETCARLGTIKGQCKAYHRCDGITATSKCRPLRDNGDGCSADIECYSSNCDEAGSGECEPAGCTVMP
jgi:hypothetical protein